MNWSSSNEAVATVDSSGTVSAHEAGTAVLTMTASNGTLTRKTTVEVVVQETEGQISTLPGKYGIDSIKRASFLKEDALTDHAVSKKKHLHST